MYRARAGFASASVRHARARGVGVGERGRVGECVSGCARMRPSVRQRGQVRAPAPSAKTPPTQTKEAEPSAESGEGARNNLDLEPSCRGVTKDRK